MDGRPLAKSIPDLHAFWKGNTLTISRSSAYHRRHLKGMDWTCTDGWLIDMSSINWFQVERRLNSHGHTAVLKPNVQWRLIDKRPMPLSCPSTWICFPDDEWLCLVARTTYDVELKAIRYLPDMSNRVDDQTENVGLKCESGHVLIRQSLSKWCDWHMRHDSTVMNWLLILWNMLIYNLSIGPDYSHFLNFRWSEMWHRLVMPYVMGSLELLPHSDHASFIQMKSPSFVFCFFWLSIYILVRTNACCVSCNGLNLLVHDQ